MTPPINSLYVERKEQIRGVWLAVRLVCICKLNGLRFTVHIEGFLLGRAVVSESVRGDPAVATLRLSLVPGVAERPEVLSGLAAILRRLLRHVNFVSCGCFHQTCLTGQVLGLMGALVTAQQSGSHPQAWSWKILHVAVVRQRGQEEEKKQEEEEEEGGAVVVLQILSRWVPAVWAGSVGARGKVRLWLELDCAAGWRG